MRQTHLGGEKVFVDFAGDTIDVIDPSSGGEVQSMKLFVAAMGASNYTYAEACQARGSPTGSGSTSTSSPSSAARRHSWSATTSRPPSPIRPPRSRPQPTYAEMEGHYSAAILAAWPRRRKDKAKVGVAVQVAQRWILARLRNQRFFSLAELNAAIKMLVVELNARQMRDFGASRAELFAELDKPQAHRAAGPGLRFRALEAMPGRPRLSYRDRWTLVFHAISAHP